MRRPILFVLLSFISGIVFQHEYIEKQLCFIGIACFSFVFIITLLLAIFKLNKEIQLRRICCFVMAFIFFFSAGSFYLILASKSIDPLYTKSNEDLVIKGTVITMQIKNENYYNILIKSEDGFKRLIQVKGQNPKPQEVIGSSVVINGIVVLPEKSRNPGLFDYKLYLKTKGIDVIIKTDSSKIKYIMEEKNIFYNSLAVLKYDFLDKIRNEMDERNFGIFNGMLFGDRSFMSDDVYEAFQKNGTAHILSVSGIHVGILYIYINKLFRNKKRFSIQIIIMMMLIFYAALSEFSPSVVRAVMMIIVHIVSKITFKRYDFLCCSAFCALAMILCNPYYIFNVGFQLSYLAIFCLAIILPWLNRRIKILEEDGKNDLFIEISKAAAPLIVIQFSMAPLSAYLFNYFSFASFFANIPIIAISGIIIPIGILMIIIAMISDFILSICISFSEILINIMVYINDIFYIPGIGYLNVKSPALLIVIVFYFVMFFLTSEWFRILFQRKKRIDLICIILALTISASIFSVGLDESQKKANMVFVDVGQGDCIHIRTESGKNVLIDGGGKVDYNVGEKILLPYLLKNNVKCIDLAIVTHLHTDHFQGIKELSNQMNIKKLGTFEMNRINEKEFLKGTGFAPNQLLYLSAGNRIYLEKDVYIDILYPNKPIKNDKNSIGKDYAGFENDFINSDENLESLLIKIYYKGQKVLITGDMGFVAEEKIMELYKGNLSELNADVLKVGHHGSNSSTSDKFLEAVDPDIAVFQVGKNNYGHPAPSVIEKCRKKDIIIYRNDYDGAIIFKEKEQKWLIKTML